MNYKSLLFPILLIFVISQFSCTEKPAIIEFPPVAILELSQLVGDTSTLFIADASNSYDENIENAQLEFQFNWGENEIWSDYSLNSTSSYKYDSTGCYVVTLRVIDSSGWTAVDIAKIEVVELEKFNWKFSEND